MKIYKKITPYNSAARRTKISRLMEIIVEQPHVLVIPCPAQGHIMPLMKLSCWLVDRGCKITFVNTESIHARLVDLLQGKKLDHISLVSIPVGLTLEEQNNPVKMHHAIQSNLPGELEKLIQNVNESSNNGKIACVLADIALGWAIDVARKMGMRKACFCPSAAGIKALLLNIPKLIEMGAIDENGALMKKDTIIWSPSMPGIRTTHLLWQCLGGLFSSEFMFRSMVENTKSSKSADWIFCNTFHELEPEAIALVPNLLPIGPLNADTQLGSLWPEDLTCLSWLDQQTENSVIYVAFGSVAVHNQTQISELALGLELLGRPFLWVVRSGLDLYGRPTTTCPEGFEDRVSHLGKIVSWAPQQKVLSHPSIACFVSHCGWNSTLDGVSAGTPFICWPYFTDQFFDETYITDVWKVGLGLNPDDDGIISRCEIKRKINQLLCDDEIKERSLKLKEMAVKSVGKGGSSVRNLELFVEELKHP